MAQDESAAAMTLAENVAAGTGIEENALLLARDESSNSSGGVTIGDRVRQRLAVCLFLYIVGVAIVTQVYPRVRLFVCKCVCCCFRGSRFLFPGADPP